MQRFIRSALVAASFACVGVSTTTLAAAPPEAITKAVAAPARPEADRARDADRKPAELIALIGLKPGARLSLSVLPLRADAPIYIDAAHRPKFADGQSQVAELRGARLLPVRRVAITP